jgi:hypothetical protein
VNCRVCDFLTTLTDEELLRALTCIGHVTEMRWPGCVVTMDDLSSLEEIADAQSRAMNAIPKHLHKYLVNRPQ